MGSHDTQKLLTSGTARARFQSLRLTSANQMSKTTSDTPFSGISVRFVTETLRDKASSSFR